MSPGSLYSALALSSPNRLLVITTEAAVGGLELALEAYRSRLGGICGSPQVFLVHDAHKGFGEAVEVANAIRGMLANGAEATVNLTGGSTVLQVAALYVGLALPHARLIAVSDDRPREAQIADPFCVGEVTPVPRPDHLFAMTLDKRGS
jgi:hypothetical protein